MITETDRISVRYHTNIREDREHNTWMFMEDFGRNIVPLYNSSKEEVNCVLEPSNLQFQKQLSEILPSSHHHYSQFYNKVDFNETILNAIEYIAQYLVQEGFLILELVTLKDVNQRVIHKLETVHGESLEIRKDKVFQKIHEDAAKSLEITKPVIIPIEKCFIIEFPKSLGGKDNYLKFLRDFQELGKQSPMMNYLNNPLIGKEGYDLSEHQRLHDLELRKMSKKFNWPHRESSGKLFSGYYFIYRHLLFRKSKILLRDYIIEELNKIILNLSERFGTKSELKIEGLLPVEKVEETLELWKTGKLQPSRINEVLYSL